MKQISIKVGSLICVLCLISFSSFAATQHGGAKKESATAEEAKTGIEKATPKSEKKAATEKSSTKGKTAVIETSEGNISIKLFPETAPKTVDNFVGLATGKKEWTERGKKVKKPLYSGVIFHRVIPNFMIQTGDPLGNGTGGPGYQFEDETKPSDSFDRPGIVAMANAGPNTNGSQFFITVAPTPWLNGKHTIFGEVTQGMEVINKISNAPRDESDKPKSEIKIKKITIK
jgi:peptidyl-prolyl cis-trans isomerase A (cyclophilin A)